MSSFKDLRIVDNFYQTSAFFPMPTIMVGTVSYTHLDVYKRQAAGGGCGCQAGWWFGSKCAPPFAGFFSLEYRARHDAARYYSTKTLL